MKSIIIVDKDAWWIVKWNAQFTKEITKPLYSTVAIKRAQYSASELERDIVDCFFVVQVWRLGPRNMQARMIDWRSSMEPAQSAPENPRREKS